MSWSLEFALRAFPGGGGGDDDDNGGADSSLFEAPDGMAQFPTAAAEGKYLAAGLDRVANVFGLEVTEDGDSGAARPVGCSRRSISRYVIRKTQ